MPLPNKGDKEDKDKFMSRCVADPKMRKEYPDIKQRIAVCISKAGVVPGTESFRNALYKDSSKKKKKKKKG